MTCRETRNSKKRESADRGALRPKQIAKKRAQGEEAGETKLSVSVKGRPIMGIMAVLVASVGLLAALLIPSGKTFGEANDENASCMGLGSSFYALFATQQRAHVAHLVKEFFAETPGGHYRVFAQEKEGGSIPSPCGTALE